MTNLPTPSEETPQEDNEPEVVQLEATDAELYASPYKDLIELERERLAIQRERNQVVSQGIELAENSDQRQFEFAMKQLDTSDAQDRRRIGLAKQVLYGLGAVALSLIGLLTVMLFFGDERQSGLALTVAEEGGKVLLGVLGGFGSCYFVRNLAPALARNQTQ